MKQLVRGPWHSAGAGIHIDSLCIVHPGKFPKVPCTRGLNKCRNYPGSVQGPKCWLRSVCQGLEQVQDTA